MAVFERRYLKKNSTGSCSGHRGWVYTATALGISSWLIQTPPLCPHPVRPIDIALRK
jgi:hypothetical protein